MRNFRQPRTYSSVRLNVIWGIFVIIFIIICVRLFYLQIISHEKFLAQANASQIKSLEIEADRGRIYANRNGQKIPLVINEQRWTMFSDTQFIENATKLIATLQALSVDLTPDQKQALASRARYVVLQRKVTDSRRLEIMAALEAAEVRGVYFQKKAIRQYLEGDLASHIVGFLNDDSQGQYGIEQFYNQALTGQPGRLQITTDVHDIPLLFIEDNTLIQPQAGQDIILTLDIPLQRLVEDRLQQGIEDTESQRGTAIILDADNGAVLAMANYPNFDPAQFKQAAIADYVNPAVEGVIEPASVVKVLVMATVLNEGVAGIEDTYYNPLVQVIDGQTISNFLYQEEGVIGVKEILAQSINTGTIEMLKRLGTGGIPDQIDLMDRQVLYDYYTNHFRLNQKTGINLPNEVVGQIKPPNYPWSVNHLYATMTFGQSISVTPIQLAAAYGAIFNGGRYYQPYVTAQIGDEVYEPQILADQILEPQTIEQLRILMRQISQRSLADVQYPGLEVSGKTGTAQVVDFEAGGYIEDASRGLMLGYIKSSEKTLIVLVTVDNPQVVYAGGQGARPIWKEIIKNIVALGRIN